MVGDNPQADAGAAVLGMTTLLLPMSPPGAEHGLEHPLGEHGRAADASPTARARDAPNTASRRFSVSSPSDNATPTSAGIHRFDHPGWLLAAAYAAQSQITALCEAQKAPPWRCRGQPADVDGAAGARPPRPPLQPRSTRIVRRRGRASAARTTSLPGRRS